MSENEVETVQENNAETTETKIEEQPSAQKTTKKTKAASTDDTQSQAPAQKASKAKKATSIDEIMATIKSMTVLELAELVKTLEAEFGVTAAAPVAATATVTAASTEAPAEEKTEFNVILKEVGANKIAVIRAVRELTTLGLKESKDLVESAPKPIKEGVNKDEAATTKQKLEEAGATVDIT